MKPEAKFYQYWKKNTPNISHTRLENTSSLGTPDALAYNKKGTFFTIEFKVTKRNKSGYSRAKFSPHQIAFHVKHPLNSFILINQQNPLDPWHLKLYTGGKILELVDLGLSLDASAEGLVACRLLLENLGA